MQHNSKPSIHPFIFITASPALSPSLPSSGEGEVPPGKTLSHQSHTHTLGQVRLTDWCFWPVRGSRSTWMQRKHVNCPRPRDGTCDFVTESQQCCTTVSPEFKIKWSRYYTRLKGVFLVVLPVVANARNGLRTQVCR